MPTPAASFGRLPLKAGKPGRESAAFTPGERAGAAAAAKPFYTGETYSHARTLREGAGVMRMIVVDGVPA
jgi:hypothetical protein